MSRDSLRVGLAGNRCRRPRSCRRPPGADVVSDDVAGRSGRRVARPDGRDHGLGPREFNGAWALLCERPGLRGEI